MFCDNCRIEVKDNNELQVRRDNNDILIELCDNCCRLHNEYEKRVRNEMANVRKRIFEQELPNIRKEG